MRTWDAIRRATGIEIRAGAPVGGGCISNAERVETNRGVMFLKSGVDYAVLDAECAALREMRPAPVPDVIAISEADADVPWLLLEWLEPGDGKVAGWRALGEALAQMHRRQSRRFGWWRDNFIGSLPQSNTEAVDWPAFWRDQRIMPQVRLAGLDSARFDRLLARIDELANAGNEDGASLLHGDLWGGNVHALRDGGFAFIDPSTYYGHREVDLAMASLFAGFNTAFFEAYEASWPLQPGARERRHLYQLYYMLVHVNLFGKSYLPGTMLLVERLGF